MEKPAHGGLFYTCKCPWGEADADDFQWLASASPQSSMAQESAARQTFTPGHVLVCLGGLATFSDAACAYINASSQASSTTDAALKAPG